MASALVASADVVRACVTGCAASVQWITGRAAAACDFAVEFLAGPAGCLPPCRVRVSPLEFVNGLLPLLSVALVVIVCRTGRERRLRVRSVGILLRVQRS